MTAWPRSCVRATTAIPEQKRRNRREVARAASGEERSQDGRRDLLVASRGGAAGDRRYFAGRTGGPRPMRQQRTCWVSVRPYRPALPAAADRRAETVSLPCERSPRGGWARLGRSDRAPDRRRGTLVDAPQSAGVSHVSGAFARAGGPGAVELGAERRRGQDGALAHGASPPVSRRTGATGRSRGRARGRRRARGAGRPTARGRPGPGGTGRAAAAEEAGAALLRRHAAEEARGGRLLGRGALDDLVQLAAVEPDAPALGRSDDLTPVPAAGGRAP